jgi:hypothetical protein
MSLSTVDKMSSCRDDLRIKNRSSKYLKAQNRRESHELERSQACVNSQKAIDKLTIREA